MARVPFARLRRRPPYVFRPSVDKELDRTGDRPSKQLMILGEAPRMGVSRTLRAFGDRIPSSRYYGGGERYLVVVDLLPHVYLSSVENLVNVRNLLVECVNKVAGITSVGRYLLHFDVLYLAWQAANHMEHYQPLRLVPTKLERIGRNVTRLAIRVMTAGTVEIAGTAADIATVLNDHALDLAGHAATEHVGEGIIEKSIANIQRFIMRQVVPRTSARFRAAMPSDELDASAYCLCMEDLLAIAIRRIQRDLIAKGSLILALDAIDLTKLTQMAASPANEADLDEIDLEDLENVRSLTFSLTNLLVNGSEDVSGIFCGRAPAEDWVAEAGTSLPTQQLGPLPCADIRNALESAKLAPSMIDCVMSKLGTASAVTPTTLSNAYIRGVRETHAHA